MAVRHCELLSISYTFSLTFGSSSFCISYMGFFCSNVSFFCPG